MNVDSQRAGARKDFSTAQLKLIRRTVARACSDAEFDEFIAVAAQCGLDPIRRQITPLVLHADDSVRRRMIPWTAIDGLRVIAARQGDYRPMESAPKLEFDPERSDADRNPLGLVRAEVCAWKHRDGAWFPVVGEAWWDEYAPLREVSSTKENGAEPRRLVLEPSWLRMGRVLLSKCAEAQALRRGWPDLISGLYGEEELHALKKDMTATERLGSALQRGNGALGQAAWFAFDPDEGLLPIRRQDIAARVSDFVQEAGSAAAIAAFLERNRHSLALFWDWEPASALKIKREIELRVTEMEASVVNAGRRRSARSPKRKTGSARVRKRSREEPTHEDAASPKA